MMNKAPLGPIKRHEEWFLHRGGPYNDEGYVLDNIYYLDELGNEYIDVEHVLRCAIGKVLSQ